jgi:CRP/FNR family transcriptional regulator
MAEEYPHILALIQSGRVKHYPRGQMLLYQGDQAEDVLLLKSGIIKMYDIDEQGNEKILHLLKAAAVFPLAFFSGPGTKTRWFYAALTDCDIVALPAEQLRGYLTAHSALTNELLEWFSREVHELLVRLSSLGKSNARTKVLAALKFLAVQHSSVRHSGWRRVKFSVNHQLIADMTGLTRESTATIMHEFQEEGLLRHPRQTILEIQFDKLFEQGNALFGG